MDFKPGNIYHVYNRGNDKQNIFIEERNYIYFLQKVRKYLTPNSDLLAYVLMPNHFHFLLQPRLQPELISNNSRISNNAMSEGIRLLLSSYTKGINKQENRTGNLIQQNTKAKCVFDGHDLNHLQYATTCFYYIHQNPVRAGLVDAIENWHYSSYRDYVGLRNGTLCNQDLTRRILDIPTNQLLPNKILNDESLKNIW